MPLRLLFALFIYAFPFATRGQGARVSMAPADSVLAPASLAYENPSLFSRLLFGTNYRRTWRMPVKLPVFYLSRSGFRMERLGGSKQTNSLYLLDGANHQWVLRSVDKSVERGLPSPLQYTPFLTYKKAQITGAYPYAAAIAGALCKAVGVTAAQPRYVFVAADSALGNGAAAFANTVCMLEERDPTPDGSVTISTDTLLSRYGATLNGRVLAKKVLRARLVDMLLGDWDRHSGQWRWATADSAGRQWWYAIPRDRDFALYQQGGVVMALARLAFEPYLIGFRNHANNVKKLSKKAWAFDGQFLKGLSEEDWKNEVQLLQGLLSDAVLAQCVGQLPAEAFALDGAMILQKLKSRRDGLLQPVLSYHRFLEKQK